MKLQVERPHVAGEWAVVELSIDSLSNDRLTFDDRSCSVMPVRWRPHLDSAGVTRPVEQNEGRWRRCERATGGPAPGAAAAAAAQPVHGPHVAMQRASALPALLFAVAVALGGSVSYGLLLGFGPAAAAAAVGLTLLAAWAIAASVKVAAAWDRAVVLRLGRFRGLRGPGLFVIVPVVDTIPYWIDVRVLTSSLRAEQTLTRDTVPVDVDAVLFWKVVDPERAALAVASYKEAISWAAQTALRDIIGKTVLADMLEGREQVGNTLQRIIDARTEAWGIGVIAVEVRDVRIPPTLQDAMSMQAQAERERQARVILGDSERQVAQSFSEAAKTYAADPVAMHLRAMNMLYEGLKQNATIVLVPSSALDTMQLSGVPGLSALSMALGKNGTVRSTPSP